MHCPSATVAACKATSSHRLSARPVLAGLGLLLAAWLCVMPRVHAADLPSASAAGQPAAGRVYVTVAGDTVERVVQKTMASSPLRAELLRQALVAANPEAIPAGRNPRLKTGTVLQLPDHDALVRSVLLPLLPPGEQASAGGLASSADQRRRWVRFP